MIRVRSAVVLAVVAAVALVAFALWPRRGGKANLERRLRTAQIEAADFYVSLRVTGVLMGARTHPITSLGGGGSRWGGGGSRVVWVATDGSQVEEGDVVLRLDAAQAEKRVSELGTELLDAEEQVRKAEADGEGKLQNAQAALTKSEEALALALTQNQAALEKARAEVEFQEKELDVAQGQRDKRKQLLAEKLVPITELESAEDEVRAREFSLTAGRRSLARADGDAAMLTRLRQLDVDKAKLELEQSETAMAQSVSNARRNVDAKRLEVEDARTQLDAVEVKAPAPGLVVLERNWRGEPVRVGDEVWEGQRVAEVLDPADMWVRCSIGEAEIERVRVGQTATVLVSAAEDLHIEGTVEALDNLARERGLWEGGIAGKKVFAALIRLEGRHEQLRPGMSATAEVHLEHVDQGLMVPAEALFEVEGKSAVYLAEGGTYRPVTVTVGQRSELSAAVKGNLKQGDSVACERPPAALIAEGGKRT